MTSTVVYRKTKWTIYFEVGTLHIRREGREVESSFSRPSIFSSIPGRTRASAARAITFSAAGLPTTATLDLRWVQPSFQSLAGPQTRHQFFRGESQVHEVAKAPTIAFSVLVLTTTSFTEICDRRQLCIQRSPCDKSKSQCRRSIIKLLTCVPTIIQIINGCLCLGLPLESGVNIANEMIAYVVTYLDVS